MLREGATEQQKERIIGQKGGYQYTNGAPLWLSSGNNTESK